MTGAERNSEIRLEGIGVSPGVAWGPAEVVGKGLEEPDHITIERDQVDAEKARLSLALSQLAIKSSNSSRKSSMKREKITPAYSMPIFSCSRIPPF